MESPSIEFKALCQFGYLCAERRVRQGGLRICYPLMSRASGFMMIFPLDSGIKEQIVGLAADSGLGIEPAFYEGVVDIIGPRAKALGSAAGVLVDLPWEFVENLVKAVMLRGSAARTTTVRAFKSRTLLANRQQQVLWSLPINGFRPNWTRTQRKSI